MAGDARHVIVAVRELVRVRGHIAPGRVVFPNGLRVTRLLVVVLRAGSDRVECLRHTPPATGHHHRVLHDVAGLEIDLAALLVFSLAIARHSLKERDPRSCPITNTNSPQVLAHQRLVLTLATLSRRPCRSRSSRTGGKQRRFPLNSAVTILASDLEGRAWLVVEIAVAVRVLAEVTIDAVHAAFEMDVV